MIRMQIKSAFFFFTPQTQKRVHVTATNGPPSDIKHQRIATVR